MDYVHHLLFYCMFIYLRYDEITCNGSIWRDKYMDPLPTTVQYACHWGGKIHSPERLIFLLLNQLFVLVIFKVPLAFGKYLISGTVLENFPISEIEIFI